MQQLQISWSLFFMALLSLTGTSAQHHSEKIHFIAEDGLKITADLYPTFDSSAPIIILFHQSVSSRGEYLSIAPRLQKAGYNALAVDLRWGRRDFWNKIKNETAERYNIDPILKAINEEKKTELIWPTIFDAYQDIEASLQWVKNSKFKGPVLVWGSSFSAMLQFKLAEEYPKDIKGLISYSPGEYYPKDTLMLEKWAKSIEIPVLVNCGKSPEELYSGNALIKALASSDKRIYQSKLGRHGSSILFEDEENWSILFSFLKTFKNKHRYLNYALEVGNWLNQIEKQSDAGVSWPDDLDSEKTSNSLSVGIAGKILFLLQLWKASKDEEWLTKAEMAGEHLLINLPAENNTNFDRAGLFSLYGNICGAGIALSALYENTQNQRYKTGLEQIVQLIKSKAKVNQDSAYWDARNDVLTGLSGTSLFLLHAFHVLKDETVLQLVRKAGNEILDRALHENEGLNWHLGQDRAFTLPNFSHGTAGVGYFLICLYEQTRDPKFLEAAKKACDYLLSIAQQSENGLLLPYGIPNEGWERLYDLGWAHGPAGSARFFYKLYEVTKEVKYLDLFSASAIALLNSGIPYNQDTVSFGHENIPIDTRFGMAGMIPLLLKANKTFKQDSYFEMSEVLTNSIMINSTRKEGSLHWSIPRYGFMGEKGKPKVFSGYFYGAAGFGLSLLQMHASLNDTNRNIKLPDDPFD